MKKATLWCILSVFVLVIFIGVVVFVLRDVGHVNIEDEGEEVYGTLENEHYATFANAQAGIQGFLVGMKNANFAPYFNFTTIFEPHATAIFYAEILDIRAYDPGIEGIAVIHYPVLNIERIVWGYHDIVDSITEIYLQALFGNAYVIPYLNVGQRYLFRVGLSTSGRARASFERYIQVTEDEIVITRIVFAPFNPGGYKYYNVQSGWTSSNSQAFVNWFTYVSPYLTWFIPMEEGQEFSFDMPGLLEIDGFEEYLESLTPYQYSVILLAVKDMETIIEAQFAHNNSLRLHSGRWLDFDDYYNVNNVAVVHRQFANIRGIGLGDVISIDVPYTQYKLGLKNIGRPASNVLHLQTIAPSAVQQVLDFEFYVPQFALNKQSPMQRIELEIVGIYEFNFPLLPVEIGYIGQHRTELNKFIYVPASLGLSLTIN